jgi:hypothetical protein
MWRFDGQLNMLNGDVHAERFNRSSCLSRRHIRHFLTDNIFILTSYVNAYFVNYRFMHLRCFLWLSFKFQSIFSLYLEKVKVIYYFKTNTNLSKYLKEAFFKLYIIFYNKNVANREEYRKEGYGTMLIMTYIVPLCN